MHQTSAQRGTDLSALFEVATPALAANQSPLNQADTQNQNHGDSMVQAFSMIAQSMATQRGSAPSSQLQMGDLLNAGMAFMNAKQQDNLQAALSALMSARPMAQKPHRQQSGQLVANALLQAIAGMSQRR